jgi:L,D-transpeptidase catalytic domain
MKSILSGQRRTLVCLVFSAFLPIVLASDVLGDSWIVARPTTPPPILPDRSVVEPVSQEEQAAAEALRKDEERRTSFFEAIADGDGEAVARMLDEGMDVNAEFPVPGPITFQKRFTDKRLLYYLSKEGGFTALMFATALNDHALVKMLLSAGADPWKVTKRHKTFALWLAAKYQNIEIMRSLMGIGPDHESNAFRITINLSKQNASLWRNGKLQLVTPISSGTRAKPTPKGRYLVTNKYRYWKSTLYPAKMPYFLRLSCGDFGLHMGRVPGYPASHGCIRLPGKSARKLYASVPIGTLVEIQ